MSDVIKLLPDAVANQIAAGEVIQRPASVIKELVENAIDAQATNVQIVLKDAGRTLIQIIDNGVGMTDTDARLAFERHSTSKIRSANDLFTLHTMGFRGEALASIAAIAQVELRTRKRGSSLGTKLIINGSVCEGQEPDMCPEGANFMIKNIFFNVPARRKFLKSNQVELSNIIKEFEKLALINHTVDFTLMNNGAVLYKLNGESFLSRISNLMGKSMDSQLVPISVDTTIVRLTGYIGKPANARKRNYLQFMFANDRYMRHPYFHKAILAAYNQLIPDDEQPNYFIKFDVDPESIDVNIHPTKTEIKFENEQAIWQIIAAGVKEALGRFSEVPSIEFDNEGSPEMPAYNPNPNISMPDVPVDRNYNPFNQGGQTRAPRATAVNWEELYKNFEQKKQRAVDGGEAPVAGSPVLTGGDDAPESNVFVDDDTQHSRYMQLKGRYILSPSKSGLMIVDQHRAHVRILFDRYIAQMTENSISSQTVMFPEVLHLSNSQNALLTEMVPELEMMGFSLASLGGCDWSINSVPSGIEQMAHPCEIVQQVIDSVENGSESLKNKLYERIALSVSRSAAIPYGRQLSQDDMEKIVSDLLSLVNPNYTPDGKTIIKIIGLEQIARHFM